MWNRIKNIEGKNKYDIDSIIDEQIKFYSKLFTSEGWDENSANKLTQHIESKLNGDEKETLELDVSIEEIKNVLKILKPTCIRRLASLILRPFTNPFWSECINFGKTTFNLSARIFAIIL
jgi:hypothetical protein